MAVRKKSEEAGLEEWRDFHGGKIIVSGFTESV